MELIVATNLGIIKAVVQNVFADSCTDNPNHHLYTGDEQIVTTLSTLTLLNRMINAAIESMTEWTYFRE